MSKPAYSLPPPPESGHSLEDLEPHRAPFLTVAPGVAVETIKETEVARVSREAALAIDMAELKIVLDSKADSDPVTRLVELVQFTRPPAGTEIPPIPLHLQIFMEDVKTWLTKNDSANFKRVNKLSWMDDKKPSTDLAYLKEDTAQYEQYLWLQRAIRIRTMMGLYKEPKAAEIAVRLLLLDAEESYQAALKQA